jgi:hypothetical protein
MSLEEDCPGELNRMQMPECSGDEALHALAMPYSCNTMDQANCGETANQRCLEHAS